MRARLAKAAAAALERCQVGDADEAEDILAQVVNLDGSYRPPPVRQATGDKKRVRVLVEYESLVPAEATEDDVDDMMHTAWEKFDPLDESDAIVWIKEVETIIKAESVREGSLGG